MSEAQVEMVEVPAETPLSELMSEVDDTTATDDKSDKTEKVETETPEPDKKAEDETSETKVDDKSDDAKPGDEAKKESPSDSAQNVPLAGLLDEREKRQNAERENSELRKQLAELTKGEDKKRPSVFDDEEGAFTSFENRIALGNIQDRMALSRDFMSMLKDDYDEHEQEFAEMARADKSLIRDMLTHVNPARFAYETAAKAREAKKLENIDEFKEKTKAEIREEVREEILAELKAEQSNDAAKRDALDPSLATEGSTGTKEVIDVDEPLEDVAGV